MPVVPTHLIVDNAATLLHFEDLALTFRRTGVNRINDELTRCDSVIAVTILGSTSSTDPVRPTRAREGQCAVQVVAGARRWRRRTRYNTSTARAGAPMGTALPVRRLGSRLPGIGSGMAIEVFADIWCPFAHVGLRAVVARRRERGREDLPIRVRAWPLELVNDAPLDSEVTSQHVAELRTQVAPDLFGGFDPISFPATSLPALALAAAAYRHSETSGERVSLALREALFEEGRNIADPTVLAQIAQSLGLDRVVTPADEASVYADWHEGQERGVKGSPHFFCGHASAYCPSLDISKDDAGRLTVHRDTAALDSFLTGCLAR